MKTNTNLTLNKSIVLIAMTFMPFASLAQAQDRTPTKYAQQACNSTDALFKINTPYSTADSKFSKQFPAPHQSVKIQLLGSLAKVIKDDSKLETKLTDLLISLGGKVDDKWCIVAKRTLYKELEAAVKHLPAKRIKECSALDKKAFPLPYLVYFDRGYTDIDNKKQLDAYGEEFDELEEAQEVRNRLVNKLKEADKLCKSNAQFDAEQASSLFVKNIAEQTAVADSTLLAHGKTVKRIEKNHANSPNKEEAKSLSARDE